MNTVKEKWIIFAASDFKFYVIEDYTKSMKDSADIILTHDIDFISQSPFDKLLVMHSTFNHLNFNQQSLDKLQKYNMCLLNVEPLNITRHVNNIKCMREIYRDMKIYDYSLANIKILKDNDIINVEHLPYNKTNNENTLLTNLYDNTEKVYDFGLIVYDYQKRDNTHVDRKSAVIHYLQDHGFSVYLITGWGIERDRELAKCKIILNIHGVHYGECINIFEHVRCDRLLHAGFKILSEESYELDDGYKKLFSNLKIIPYSKFLQLNHADDVWKSIE